jgi:DNA-binding transcriptional regulator YbjK
MAERSERETRVLDAAIAVLGTRGLRQLTHRTVDTAAGLPLGSTSNVFRTRETLIMGVLDRLVEVETAAWGRLAGPAATGQVPVEEFAELVAQLVRELAGPAKAVTLARHAIFHEAAFSPPLQEKIRVARSKLAQWGEPLIAHFGSPVPRRHYLTMLAVIDGLLSNQLASPDDDFDPLPSILVVLQGLKPVPHP